MNNDPRSPIQKQFSTDAAPDPQFMREFQEAINSWAEATSAGKTQEAHNVAMQVLLMAGEEALKNPSSSLLLQQEADDLEHKGDWLGAETVRRKVLALEEASGDFGTKAQLDLCQLLRVVGRSDESWQFAVAATASARRTEMFPLIYMALENEARCALDRVNFPRASAAASEAVRIIEPGKMFELMRASALTTLARCLLAANDSAGAELQLLLAWELLEERSSDGMLLPGPIRALANWWEVKSQIEERRGDLGGALAAITRAIEFRRLCEGPYALFALSRTLKRLGEISKAVGDSVGEELVLSEAKCIREGLKLFPNK